MKYILRETIQPQQGELLGFSDTVRNLFIGRGVFTNTQAAAFLSPDYDAHTHDPFLMRDMQKVIERVYKAVKEQQKVIIFSDYDADGIPGAVVLHDMFKKIGFTNFEVYIPHRHNEGFGLNMAAILEFKEKGARLIITIDCGISDVEKVARAEELGMNVIITDHHVPHEVLPPAYAILNPKLIDCPYPEKMLCGSGVIFKFVQAFLKNHGSEFKVPIGWEKWLLDMVGIATLSDMVPLVGENRVFAYYGLKVLKKTPRPGLSQLFSKLRVKREHLTEDDVGFTISPRINAASRMGEPEQAFKLLSTDDEALAGAYADGLEQVNNERKGTVAALVKEIKKILSERDMYSKRVIVAGNPSWRPALLGLAANTFATEYGKPVFLWGRDGDNVIKGSCRSGKSGSVLALMQHIPDIFIEYGGHGAAGGFAVKTEAIHILEAELEAASVKLDQELREPSEYVDAHISLEDISWNLYKDIERLAPFGTGNTKPLFMVKGAYIDSIKSFGKEGNHIEIVFSDSHKRKISAIQFFMSKDSLPKHVLPQSSVDIVVHLEKSVFKNYPELRLRIVDIL